jgi:hypothetical protein
MPAHGASRPVSLSVETIVSYELNVRLRSNNNLNARFTIATLAMQAILWSSVARSQPLEWSLRPYRIKTFLAVDGPSGASHPLARTLPKYLSERVVTAVGPLWDFEIEVTSGGRRPRILEQIDSLSGDSAADFDFAGDKIVLLGVRWSAGGYELSAREFDVYVQRWGPVLRRDGRQQSALPEQLLDLLWRAVAPLAKVEVDEKDPLRVVLTPRGVDLPQQIADHKTIRAGDVMLPFVRRTDRNGAALPKGVQAVPWTFVETASIQDDGRLVGRLHSGIRRPLGVGRRGRIEQVAIALRGDPTATTLKLVSRSKSEEPLVGYEVHFQRPGSDESTLLGLTDKEGAIQVAPGDEPVQWLTIKNGGELLARLPLAPGAESEISVRVVEDDIRFQAQTRLAAMREELVDVIARRSILMARVRQKIEAGDFKLAQELLTSIDQLPGYSYFNQVLTRERRLHRGADAKVQQRIEQLISATESVLNQYLDVRPIRELQQEIRTEQSKSGGS